MRSNSSHDRRRRLALHLSLQNRQQSARERPSRPRPILESAASEANDLVDAPEIDIRLDGVPPVLRRLMTRQEPTVWLMAGDSYLTAGKLTRRKWRNYVEHFQRIIQEQFGRSKDVVIDATTPESYIGDLSGEFKGRVARFRPDIVFVATGSQESLRGINGLEAFEHGLHQIITESQALGAQCVLQTPPCLALPGAVGVADLVGYIEVIRDIAEADGISLVDHWKHWEFAAVDGGGVSNWTLPKYGIPGEIGHKQLAKTLVEDLGVRRRKLTVG